MFCFHMAPTFPPPPEELEVEATLFFLPPERGEGGARLLPYSEAATASRFQTLQGSRSTASHPGYCFVESLESMGPMQQLAVLASFHPFLKNH